MAHNTVFRNISLKRLSSPEQLDSLLTVVRPKGWLALIGLTLVVAAGLVWAVMGTIPIKVGGEGLLIRGGGVHQIAPHVGGRLVDVRIAEGDQVTKGQVVARIAVPELEEELVAAHREVVRLEQALALESTARDPAALVEARASLARLQELFLAHSRVVAPADGRVLEVRKKSGDFIAQSESLASFEASRDDVRELDVVIFVPAELGQRIVPGMEAQVSPLTASVEEYGFILGKAVSVSEYPVSRQGMLSLLGNQELVDRFSVTGGALVEVRIEMVMDPSTPSGYRWSASDGPPSRLQSGTLVSAAVVIDRERPINMILPGRTR